MTFNKVEENRKRNFWKRVVKTTSCWNWSGSLNNSGYGTVSATPQNPVGAHRFSWELHSNKKIPKGKYCLHTCDNRKCVNPKHLFIGTQKINIIDCVKKKRQVHSRKTHCKWGHSLIFSNIYFGINQKRRCKVCHDAYTARYRKKGK